MAQGGFKEEIIKISVYKQIAEIHDWYFRRKDIIRKSISPIEIHRTQKYLTHEGTFNKPNI